jgi:murein DD-endopeptidase MepM/ murein hydrolase activator NlpD
MSVDPRSHHFETIFPREWMPFVNSVHPQVYWETMRREPDDVLEETFRVWGSYGKPIIPALQGDADANSMEVAQTLATQRYKARALSWWRLGVIGPVEFRALNRPIQPGTQPPPPPPQVIYGPEQVIKPGDSGYSTFSFTGQNELQSFQGTWGWTVYYKVTEAQVSKAAVRWSIQLPESAKYEVSTFVPARHATTQNARFKIHGVRGSSTEILVTVDQSVHDNQWVSLGVFDFDKNAMNAGTVFLNDLTGETDKEIAFDAIRWRKVIQVSGDGTPTPPGYADGYDSPVGTSTERRSAKVWPGQWFDASPFGKLYFVGTPSEAYHTGADLNLPNDADAHTGVYSTAGGTVTFASRLPTWGNVIVIRHDPLPGSGLVMYSRYAHVEEIMASVGQHVTRGQQIAKVGNAFGRWAYHLHFDLSPTNILEMDPSHWPKKDRDALYRNYVDPREFILANRPR